MTTEVIRVIERRRKYHWPEAQLNFWLVVMTASGATILGVFAYFMHVQAVMRQGVPWYVSETWSAPILTPLLPFSSVHEKRVHTNDEQVIPLLNRDRDHNPRLPLLHPRPHLPTTTPPRHRRARFFHPVRALAHRAH